MTVMLQVSVVPNLLINCCVDCMYTQQDAKHKIKSPVMLIRDCCTLMYSISSLLVGCLDVFLLSYART